MIPVTPAPEPGAFQARVREPGERAIAEMVGKKPKSKRVRGKPLQKIAARERDIPASEFPAYWTEALDDLMAAYDETCAYSCFRIHPTTGARSVDHFIPKSRAWRQVYEWSNYRLSCSVLNARKGDFQDVLDPFALPPNRFRLELTGFTVFPRPRLKKKDREAVQSTIDRLNLNGFRRERAEDAEGYWAKEYSLATLKKESPFVAQELRRHKRLIPGDKW